ncbi:MAG TPA: S49 family peptidase [Gemmatimonadaceae bacterium]|nr:S49 family peptidase [Gemmatimonadaceae bacterium]
MTKPKRPALNVLHAITTRHWAIMPDTLELITEIALRENRDPEAIAAELGRPLENTRAATARDRVATIPVVGPMFRYADRFTEISAAVTYEELAADFNTALRDSSIDAIILAIDSPGGEVTGISELADLVRAGRGVKPIVALAADTAASAAYWLASAADEVVTTATGILGSIGVRASFVDTRKRDEAMGRSRIEIVSSQSPRKAVDPATEEGRAQILVTLDALAEVFVQAVADNRGVTRDFVLEHFGQGDVLVGQAAVDAGLADRIGTLESLHAELSAGAARASLGGARLTAIGRRTAEENNMPEPQKKAGSGASAAPDPNAETGHTEPAPVARLTPEQVAARYPDVISAAAEAARAEGRTEGATAERARLAAIDAVAIPGHEALVAAARADSNATADTLARQILEAEQGTRANRLAALRGDEQNLNAPQPLNAGEGESGAEALVASILAVHETVNPGRTVAGNRRS